MANGNEEGNSYGYGYGNDAQGGYGPEEYPRTQAMPPQYAGQRQVSQQPAPGGFVSAYDQAAAKHAAHGSHGAHGAYDQYSRVNADYAGKARPGMSRGKKIGIAIAVLVLVGAIVAGVMFVMSEMRKANFDEEIHDMEDLEAVDQALTGNTSFDAPFTMLLLGSDERIDDPGMGARTDTIILVRIDPVNKAVAMVSIPRDTMVNLPGYGVQKINAAFTYGGAAGAIEAVTNLTGIPIDHYAAIDFSGLVGLVDAIGGIDVHVDERIENPKAGDAIVEAGDQHLNGAQALVLARDRDYVDGDYTRQVHQRQVIMGIVERMMNAYATELAGLVQASASFLKTDSGITFDWLFSLADQMRHTNIETPLAVKSATLPSQPAYIDGVSYVIADTAGMAELMQIFTSGGDVSQPLTQSSIGDDLARAGYTGDYTEPVTYYTEEETYYTDDTENNDEGGDSGGEAEGDAGAAGDAGEGGDGDGNGNGNGNGNGEEG